MRLETARLALREWRDEDKPLYTAIVGDPEVRRYFPELGTAADVELVVERSRDRLADLGYAFMAVERREDGAFMGLLGMAPLKDSLRLLLPGAPAVEIGWQLGRQFWGQGYAPEGATAMLGFAWRQLALPEVVAITYSGNLPSRRVMEKIGMRHDPRGDFDHPDLPRDHLLRPHVLYRIANPALRD